MSRHAARMAERLAEIHDKAIDVIDQALDKFRSDTQATDKMHIDGEWVAVPVMRLMLKDRALLIDRLQKLFDGPPSSASIRASPSAPSSLLMPCASSSRRHGGGQG